MTTPTIAITTYGLSNAGHNPRIIEMTDGDDLQEAIDQVVEAANARGLNADLIVRAHEDFEGLQIDDVNYLKALADVFFDQNFYLGHDRFDLFCLYILRVDPCLDLEPWEIFRKYNESRPVAEICSYEADLAAYAEAYIQDHHPKLWRVLEDSNTLGCFDFGRFFHTEIANSHHVEYLDNRTALIWPQC